MVRFQARMRRRAGIPPGVRLRLLRPAWSAVAPAGPAPTCPAWRCAPSARLPSHSATAPALKRRPALPLDRIILRVQSSAAAHSPLWSSGWLRRPSAAPGAAARPSACPCVDCSRCTISSNCCTWVCSSTISFETACAGTAAGTKRKISAAEARRRLRVMRSFLHSSTFLNATYGSPAQKAGLPRW